MRARRAPRQPGLASKPGASFEILMGLDAKLAAHGVPPLGLWWQDVLAPWYRHPTALTLIVCAGRGSAKSHTLYKVGLCEALFGGHVIPIGERHSVNLTSRLKDEGAKGTAIISQWLTLLGARHTPTDGLIELTDMPIDIRVSAASVAGNSGWRSIFDGADEVAKWATEGALAVDAREVLASKSAMTTTHPGARHMIVSTPFVDSGPFYDLVSEGSNDRQVVAVAPTWIATDGRITKEQTYRLEPNARVHAREYGAEFSAGWEDGFFVGLIDPCVAPWSSQPYQPGTRYTVSIDPAFARDLFAISIAHADGDRVIVDRVEAIAPPRTGEGLSPTACLRRVRAICAEYRVHRVLTDQHHAATLTELADREGVKLEPIAWTPTSKSERFEQARILMRDLRLVIPNDKPLLRELNAIGTKLLPSGHERIEGRAGVTDDRVSAVVLGVSTLATSTPGSRMARALKSFDLGRQQAALGVRDMTDLYGAEDIARWRGFIP